MKRIVNSRGRIPKLKVRAVVVLTGGGIRGVYGRRFVVKFVVAATQRHFSYLREIVRNISTSCVAGWTSLGGNC